MTLDEFLRVAPGSLEAFATFVRRELEEAVAQGEAVSGGSRTESEWWDAMAAYQEYVELTDALAEDRRRVFADRRKGERW